MTSSTNYGIDPGYGSQEEMEAHEDHIQRGTFRFIIAVLVILIGLVLFAVQWTKLAGTEAQMANSTWEGTPAARVARAEATKMLSEYEVVDPEAGTYRIPIERAMELEVEDGGGE